MVSISNNFTLNWSTDNIGFGQFRFYEKDGELFCDNEMMSKEFVKRMLCQMVDECAFTQVRVPFNPNPNEWDEVSPGMWVKKTSPTK